MSEIVNPIAGACLEHPDRSGTPCDRCGTFRCDDCRVSGLCPRCREIAAVRPPAPEDTVGFGPRAGGRIVDLVVGGLAALSGGVLAVFALVVLQVAGIAAPGWAQRLDHGLLFNMLSGLSAGIVAGTLSTTVCGASLGKLVFKLRVVQSDGRRPRFGKALIREAAYLLDSFFFGLVGKAAMDSSALQQRHGDRLADTVVIRKDAVSPEAQPSGGRLAAGIFLGFAGHMLVIAIFMVVAAS